ncbi:hypothetical protein PAXINDRAFT_22141 [Paxillus involutus ATCC 200175]|uniref:Uncharacterized protein n=1 Tax=Paxillus involutus ATCC 200175 TaxID=664439 RepID=A0A0C9TBC4_PAXIN|nr:hypothetical protein PAXINDRAFT_22141 [Paxillus involutus ATCC 200175]
MAGVNGTWGASFVGLIVACILYGLTVVQTYFYYSTYPNDSSFLKALVAILWALDTAHTAVISHSLYFYLITDFGIPTTTIIWSLTVRLFTSLSTSTDSGNKP